MPEKKSESTGAGCLILFGIPFFAVGLLCLGVGIKRLVTGGKDGLALAGFGVVFGGVGFGIMLGGFYAGKSVKKQREKEQKFPDQPWLWRGEWKDGVVKSSASAGAVVMGIFALFWNAISWTAVFAAPWQEELAKNKAILLVLLFPAVGILLIIMFVYQLLKGMKYGKSDLHMDTLPGVIGGQFRGTVKIDSEVFPEKGFSVRLVSVQQYQSGSGKNRSTEERVLWEDDRTVKEFERRNRGTEVPVAFTIPSSASATTLGSPGHDVIWRVHVAADTPGIDYGTSFQIPVFVTEDSVDGVEPDSIDVDDAALIEGEETTDDRSIQELCRELGVVYRHSGRGRMTMNFKAFQNKKAGCGVGFFFLIWTGIVVALFMFKAPIFFAIIFGLFDVMIFFMVLSMVFSSSTIEVNSREIRITKKLLFFGGTKRIPLANFQSITPKSNTQVGDKRIYHLMFKDKNGKEINAGGQIPSKTKATTIIYEIMKVVRENSE